MVGQGVWTRSFSLILPELLCLGLFRQATPFTVTLWPNNLI